ncbi:MAG TPA: adenylyltransferase/cytidyltransferase family protein, partial [Candidatus Izemoplasmatales bacterium]|nr:adenylyltransferase/cytidyltransferase family protein [Candidatus Izemoplasmatales bacterium]
MRIGFYPGSFDPITYGHLDIITRGAKLFDKLYIAISNNPNKQTVFTTEERIKLVKECVEDIDSIEVIQSNKLT